MSEYDRASKPKHPILAKLRSPKNPFHHLFFKACCEVILLRRSRRKLYCVKVTRWNTALQAIPSIRECNSTI